MNLEELLHEIGSKLIDVRYHPITGIRMEAWGRLSEIIEELPQDKLTEQFQEKLSEIMYSEGNILVDVWKECVILKIQMEKHYLNL